MHGATDTLRSRIYQAVLRRRVPLWLTTLLPLLLAALLLPGARAPLCAAAVLVLGGAAYDLWRWRRRVSSEWASWVDAAVPALEDSSALLDIDPATPIAHLQRQRLQARLLLVLEQADYRAIARARVRLNKWNLAPLLLSLGAVAIAAAWATVPPPSAAGLAKVDGKAIRPIAAGEVYLRVQPPAYTGVAAFDTVARDISVPQYSRLRWCVRETNGVAPSVELGDGQVLPVTPDCATLRADESLFWRLRGQGGKRYKVGVRPDEPPRVDILAPRELIELLRGDAQGVQLSVSVKDDYAVARASLHLTLARGSGENIRFSDREMPLPQSADPRTRQWQKQWTLAELGMEPGDELYFFVRASDNAPDHPHSTQSPTYTLRLPGPAGDSLDASALPSLGKPENLRSQRQIIIDTEQLLADMRGRPTLPAAIVRERSEGIAADQAQLRLRYGQFLGEESTLFGDEHGAGNAHEGERGDARGGKAQGGEAGIVAAFGHAHDQQDNATIFDPQTKAVLKRALSAMWDAEKALRAITPAGALAPEHKALVAIKELQQAERVYLHRTAFPPPALKEEKRMSGDLAGAQSYQRPQGAPRELAAPEVRDLLRALAQDGPLPALWSKTARASIGDRLRDPEQKLAAQRAVQDVQDGCASCRGVLRAWLRATLEEAPVLLQARPEIDTAFRQRWRGKEQP
ncbi:hypothetical protein HSX11_18295 [Oxalobacteraceae bacterium]|nr:hypothetical protein [Oxalobacteraceae bacterium]